MLPLNHVHFSLAYLDCYNIRKQGFFLCSKGKVKLYKKWPKNPALHDVEKASEFQVEKYLSFLKMDKKNVQNENMENLLWKSVDCEHKNFLASGHQKYF